MLNNDSESIPDMHIADKEEQDPSLLSDSADDGIPQGSPTATSFSPDAFMAGLDDLYSLHPGPQKVEQYLTSALEQTVETGDEAGQLTVINELMGFYRSQSRHSENVKLAQTSLDLALHLGLEGSPQWVSVLINAATAMRAAQQYDQALELYKQALSAADQAPQTDSRTIAALHNNLSMLYSQTGNFTQAYQELYQALTIMTKVSPDPQNDIDIATTKTNLALVLLQIASSKQKESERKASSHSSRPSRSSRPSHSLHETAASLRAQAVSYAQQALNIYHHDPGKHLTDSAHYASALAGYAQAAFFAGQFEESRLYYRKALEHIRKTYGADNDYYRTTLANSRAVQEIADSQDKASLKIKGLDLARQFWQEYGEPLIYRKYPEYRGRIAAGLVGHGSECYGFDDDLSHDHDFGPRFCLWVTEEDYQKIGHDLQADYDALPQEFLGFQTRSSTPRSQGRGRRSGVFKIGDFFESITGLSQAPGQDEPLLWLNLQESTLAAATNGQIFADPLGAFSSRRQGFKNMPDDVRFSLISRRLGMISQAGQYNYSRMIARKDQPAARLCLSEFANATSSLIFLINNPLIVGYAPYYKWRFAALRNISRRPSTRLSEICEQLENLLLLDVSQDNNQITSLITTICREIVEELQQEGLTSSSEDFLEWHRPYVESHISEKNSFLRSL